MKYTVLYREFAKVHSQEFTDKLEAIVFAGWKEAMGAKVFIKEESK